MKNVILAPYGSLSYLSISTKVGNSGKGTMPAVLAPYGALKHLPIATKVGVEKDRGGGTGF